MEDESADFIHDPRHLEEEGQGVYNCGDSQWTQMAQAYMKA